MGETGRASADSIDLGKKNRVASAATSARPGRRQNEPQDNT